MPMQSEAGYQPSPECPSCGLPMRYMRSFSQHDRSQELQTFECSVCGVAFTEVVEAKQSQPAALAVVS
jgi:transposase-like protein